MPRGIDPPAPRAAHGLSSPPRWLRSPLPAALAATALGALFSLSFLHAAAWPASLALLALFAWLVDGAAVVSVRRAAWTGWAFGCGWLTAGTWWLFVSMHRYGGMPAPLAALAVWLLAAALSLYLGVVMAAYARWRPAGTWARALLFAACWLAAELARGVFFTGFPWLASGYAQVDGPLAGYAPWLGVYGIGALAAWIAALLAAPAAGWRARLPRLAALLLLLAIGPLAGRDTSRPAGTIEVSLLQPNVAQESKFAADQMDAALQWLTTALREAPGDLVVAPETAVPLLPAQLGTERWRALRDPFSAAGGRRAALVGMPLGRDDNYTNSAVGFAPPPAASAAAPAAADDAGVVADKLAPPFAYRYDKHHLVPFGEFVPFGFGWFVRLMQIPLGDFARGPVDAPSLAWHGQRIGPNICYEDLFGEELARRFGEDATAPTLLVNISNIAWFGDTIALPQHLAISRMRTLELQRPMLRSTNTGMTAVIDHRGRVSAVLPAHTRGVLTARVEGRDGRSFFAHWASRFGLAPLWLACAIVIAFAAWRGRGRGAARTPAP